ncbi:MAG: GNAT family N-acetyltransferase [Kofleriaceae bacterium]|nr:GNAT family N-acetyltransferase [Kofleriaceae bacterium]
MELRIQVRSWRDWEYVVDHWRDLVDRCPSASFFVSPDWVSTWLEIFGTSLEPKLVHFFDDESTLVGACLLVERSVRKGPFKVRRVYLNTAGEDDDDSPCVEHNMLFCEPGFERSMAAALRRCLSNHRMVAPWDELCVPGVLDGESLGALAESFDDLVLEDECRVNRYVSLDHLRMSGSGYLESLEIPERMHARMNIRMYSELGPLELVEAASTDEALRFLEGLAVLHRKRRHSAFGAEKFYKFHQRLVRRCFQRGNIQLVQLRAGNAIVGFHYYLRYRGRTSFYQYGYDDALRPENNPGLTMHAVAAQDALDGGLREYDFMAGDVEYQRGLAALSREMHWLSFRMPTLKMKTLDGARQAKRRISRPGEWARGAYRTIRRPKAA